MDVKYLEKLDRLKNMPYTMDKKKNLKRHSKQIQQ